MPRFWRFLRISMFGIGVLQSVLLWLIIDGALIPSTMATGISHPTMASTSAIPYQGRLVDRVGNAINGSQPMTFRLYPAENSVSAVWAEVWDGTNQVLVQNGLFNVMLGKITPIPQQVITSNTTLWLGITVGSDAELMPRIQLGSVPYAIQALTVPDGSITSAKIADGAVTVSKLALPTASMCLATDTNLTLLGNWASMPIPTMNIDLVLTRSSKLLIIASGVAHFTGSNHVGTGVNLNGNTLLSTQSLIPNTGWQPFNIIRIVTLPEGEYTLNLYAYAQEAGTITYGGNELTTCLQYILYSE